MNSFKTCTGGNQSSTCFLPVREFLPADRHGKCLFFAVLVFFLLCLQSLDCHQICLEAADALLYGCDLDRVSPGNVRLQTVALVGVIGFKELQAAHLYVEIHLLLDRGIAGSKRLDLGV